MNKWTPTIHQLEALALMKTQRKPLVWWSGWGWTTDTPPARQPLQSDSRPGHPEKVVTISTFNSLLQHGLIRADRNYANPKKDSFEITDDGCELVEKHKSKLRETGVKQIADDRTSDQEKTLAWLADHGYPGAIFPALSQNQLAILDKILNSSRMA